MTRWVRLAEMSGTPSLSRRLRRLQSFLDALDEAYEEVVPYLTSLEELSPCSLPGTEVSLMAGSLRSWLDRLQECEDGGCGWDDVGYSDSALWGERSKPSDEDA